MIVQFNLNLVTPNIGHHGHIHRSDFRNILLARIIKFSKSPSREIGDRCSLELGAQNHSHIEVLFNR